MKRAVVVKFLTDSIYLIRNDEGNLMSLLVPCRPLNIGSMLLLRPESSGCPIYRVDGKSCRHACRRDDYAVIIEHKDEEAVLAGNLNRAPDRHAI